MMKLLKVNYHSQLIEIMLKSTLLGTISVNLLTPFLLSFILLEYIDRTYIYIWLIINVTLFFLRVLSIGYGNKANSRDDGSIQTVLYFIYTVVFISAIVHGMALFYASFYIPEVQLFFVAIITIAMVAGSISTLGSVYNAFFIYVVFNILPIVFVFTYHGGNMFYTFSFAVFVFMFAMLRSGRMQYNSLYENIILKESFERRVEESTSELKENNKKLNQSVRNFQDLLDTSMVLIAFHNQDGILIDMNKSAIAKFGYDKKSDIIGKHITNVLPPKSIPIVIQAMENDTSDPYELIMKKKDGTEFPTLISAKYTMLNGERVRMTTMMDLTDIKEKDRLIQTQSRLAQMGEMITMIAHQWRQPLSAISATSTAINLKAQLNKLDKEYIIEMTDNISGYSQHLSDTIDDFRNFFKPNKEKVETSFSELLDSVLKIISVSMDNHNIKLIREFDSEVQFHSYSNEIKQVILNLFKNSEDIFIDKKIENAYIKVVIRDDEDSIILEISDNAGGIPESIIDDIFTPYFSTKKKKDGTGLGLYMSKVIIEEHCQGELLVHNGEDGAVFQIILKKELR